MVMSLYLDEHEIRLLRSGYGFVGSKMPKPDEGLVQLVNIEEAEWNIQTKGEYLVCERKGGEQGDWNKYFGLVKKELGGGW